MGAYMVASSTAVHSLLLLQRRDLRCHDDIHSLVPARVELLDALGHRLGAGHPAAGLDGDQGALVELRLELADVRQLGQLLLLELGAGRELLADAEEDVAVLRALQAVQALDLWHHADGLVHAEGLGPGPALSVLLGVRLVDVIGGIGLLQAAHERLARGLAWRREPAAAQALLAALQHLREGLEGRRVSCLEAASCHRDMVRQGEEALLGVWHGEGAPRGLVEQAVDVAAQRVERAFGAIGLDSLVERLTSLHRHVPVAEQHVIAHEAAHRQLRHRGLLRDQLREVGLAVVLQVVGVEVVVHLARQRRLVNLTLPPLQNTVNLEANVVDLREPLDWHVFWEHPSIPTSFREIKNHVLNERPTENIVVLEGGPLVQQLVILARGASAIECLPALLEICFLLCVVLLALRVLHGTSEVVMVVVVFLHKRLPILVGIEPLRL
mmetsp:Transcript_45886/g.121715  ORF Transcript_45886/g.121715 Transcript_45886/m.121715 type:complete len:440 (+) Transcript_45886:396-1715(+)